MSEIQARSGHVSRRAVTRAAVWSVPTVAVVAAAPAFAASVTDIGAYTIDGSCGVLGAVGPGFVITAPVDAPIPAGSSITITGTGVANIGAITPSGPATVAVAEPSPTTRTATLASDLPAGSRLELRSALSLNVAFTLTGVGALPSGYTATGAKNAGSVSSTLVLCSAT
ncbi:hypothetical protein [Nocardioides sp. ChNu-99]|uniref:hypothetical protein n=1 Tax=Nocardioides sp. ChNu-99 TaxID=2839897 RepID=UPI00240588BC|nr:hypothetical protein [Nocardioides sp. ChNu-99]MDF9716506.1 hypothetical protein [Nocardioides sp. ChNu-99]